MNPFCFLNIITAVICGVIAHNKGRNVIGWSLLGILGLIPVIVVACLPNLNEQAARDAHVDEENRRLREQLRQERIKSESFRQHATARLDAHDQHMDINTRTMGPALGTGAASAGQLGAGNGGYDLIIDDPTGPGGPDVQWYYSHLGKTVGPVKASEITRLIGQQIITSDTLLWSESMSDWRAASHISNFAAHFT